MGNINQYFDTSEFACKCGCGFGENIGDIDLELICVLTDIRERFNQPVRINSGCRCPEHNKAIGGAEKSQHLLGTASDIKVRNTSPAEVCAYLNINYPTELGVGKYTNWTHVDSREEKARWGFN